MMKTAFVCDSGSSLSIKEAMEQGCYSVPLQISYDNVSKLENETISIDEVFELMSQGVELKTSLAPLGEVEALFASLKEQGYERVFAIPICSGLSGTINVMKIAAENVGIAFDFFDCHVTAMVEKYMIIRSKQLYDQGKSLEEIKVVLTEICDATNTLLVPDDLQHLRRGGRLTPFAATLGGLLKIKPILEINKRTEGKIDVVEKVRTMSKALDRVVEIMKSEIQGDGLGYQICFGQVLCEDIALSLKSKCEEFFPKASYEIIKLVSVVSIHTGIGCIAIQYFPTL